MRNGEYIEYQRIIGDKLNENHGENYRFMRNIAHRILDNYQDAEDAVQESMIAILTTTSPYKTTEQFRYWAGKIVANKCKDMLKSPRGNGSIHLGDRVNFIPDDNGDPLGKLVSSETQDTIEKEVMALPKHFRTCIFNLMLGKSYSQISEEISAPLGTVKSRIHSGRKILRERLKTRDVL